MYQSIGYAASTARSNAKLTQEYAAEKLHISPRTLSAYENDRFPGGIPDDVMFNMIKLYNASWLGYEWLRMSFKTGGCILPDISFDPLSSNALGVQVEIDHVSNVQSQIAEICRDNVVGHDEVDKWKMCMKEVRELIGALFSLKLAPIQKETASTDMLTVNR